MNILIVNDDGITALGIHQLVKYLHKGFPEANLYVCAPDRQRTAAGHGITVRGPVFLKEEEFEYTKAAWSCSGTPADCVKAGIRLMSLEGERPDLVCSGINMGSNLGNDVLYSGTVSAALEGIICGIPSVAFSVCDHDATHFEAFETLVPSVCNRALQENTTRWILNVNVPDLPKEEIQGIRYTKLGERIYSDDFSVERQEDGLLCYLYLGHEVEQEELPLDNDVRAFQENYISITPVHRDLTKDELVGEMLAWGIQW